MAEATQSSPFRILCPSSGKEELQHRYPSTEKIHFCLSFEVRISDTVRCAVRSLIITLSSTACNTNMILVPRMLYWTVIK